MATGKTHDRVGLAIGLFYVVLAINLLPRSAAIVSIYSYFAGILYLSPDLDIPQSEPSQRWGALAKYWKLYQKAMKHRGLSHWVFFGTLSRTLYLLPLALPVFYSIAWGAGWEFYGLIEMREEFAAAFIGLEISAWVHLALDYTPILRKL